MSELQIAPPTRSCDDCRAALGAVCEGRRPLPLCDLRVGVTACPADALIELKREGGGACGACGSSAAKQSCGHLWLQRPKQSSRRANWCARALGIDGIALRLCRATSKDKVPQRGVRVRTACGLLKASRAKSTNRPFLRSHRASHRGPSIRCTGGWWLGTRERRRHARATHRRRHKLIRHSVCMYVGR